MALPPCTLLHNNLNTTNLKWGLHSQEAEEVASIGAEQDREEAQGEACEEVQWTQVWGEAGLPLCQLSLIIRWILWICLLHLNQGSEEQCRTTLTRLINLTMDLTQWWVVMAPWCKDNTQWTLWIPISVKCLPCRMRIKRNLEEWRDNPSNKSWWMMALNPSSWKI